MFALFAWRTACQFIVGGLVTYAASLGVNLDQEFQGAALVATYAAGAAVYATVVHFLETRPGDGLPARAARALARLLMLGAGRPPVYAPADKAVIATPRAPQAPHPGTEVLRPPIR